MEQNTGKIKAISISVKKGIPKSNIDNVEVVSGYGIKGDAHAGNWHRQISLLAMESIEKMKRAGLDTLLPGAFAENITTEAIDISKMEIGSHLRLGEKVILEITQIGKKCHSRCPIFYAVGDCVMPKEGIFAKVIEGGEIFINDEIEIVNKHELEPHVH